MKDNYSKDVVIEILKEIGIEAERIPSQFDLRTPDIKAWHEKEQYIVELKIKSDNPVEIERERESLRQGEIVSTKTPTGPRNRLYAIISDGVSQMSDYDPNHNFFHVVWLHSSGRDNSLLNMRFHSTLFGTQDLISTQRTNLMTCYYFKESAFYSHSTELDGAILTHQNKLQLCVNTLSSNYLSFKQSHLYQTLPKGLCDPEALEEKEDAMIADCNFDRKEENKILNYLKEKYHLNHLMAINMKQYSAIVALPDEKRKES